VKEEELAIRAFSDVYFKKLHPLRDGIFKGGYRVVGKPFVE
jgi:hypothetical protein